MRRNMGFVLIGLSGLLLAVAVLAVTWAPDKAKRTPLDVDTHTVYTGEAAKIDTSTGAFDKKTVYAIQETKADSEKSSDDHVLFVETSCLVVDTGGAKECVNGNDPDLITAGVDIFATDRVTALAVDDPNLPDDAVVHEGLVNKWPFDTEKKTYPYWDDATGQAIDMEYDGTEVIKGLTTYRFVATVEDAPIDVAEGVPGTYSNVVTVNIDPTTGAIIKGGQDQQRFLEDGTPVPDVQLTWTDDTIRTPSTRRRPPAPTPTRSADPGRRHHRADRGRGQPAAGRPAPGRDSGHQGGRGRGPLPGPVPRPVAGGAGHRRAGGPRRRGHLHARGDPPRRAGSDRPLPGRPGLPVHLPGAAAGAARRGASGAGRHPPGDGGAERPRGRRPGGRLIRWGVCPWSSGTRPCCW